MHVKIIRLFVESVLRYGLPAKYTAVVFRYDRPRIHNVYIHSLRDRRRPCILHQTQTCDPSALLTLCPSIISSSFY